MLCVRGEAGGERDAEPGDNHRQDPRGEDTQGKFGQCFLGSLKPGGKGGCSTPLGFSKPVSLWRRILSTVVVVGLIAGCRLNLSCCQSISQLELVGTGMM